MIIPVKTTLGGYDIILKRGALQKAEEYLNLNRKVLIVTDSGVPDVYAQAISKKCKESKIFVFQEGEQSKNFDTYKNILSALCQGEFTRSDCVVAVGGGVVGDMAGFAAASYMRGIDFYNIPTTVLSQVDSSIGGKTAIDFMGYKNIIGAFYQPKCVIIDSETLKTLPPRQISNGLAESVKMALTSDKELFELFENEDIQDNIDEIIYRSLLIKKSVVEQDEKETGLRKILNFGHTVGHAIESVNIDKYYHGECVALGMLYFSGPKVKPRLINVLKKLNLPVEDTTKIEDIISASAHDKKKSGSSICVVSVESVGEFSLENIDFNTYSDIIRKAAKQ
ncbi:MAG: 3-dehydroquinate synthase [Clostridia bacterium]|nr:3-dehydroquinate synthase [Clostridia bacterium]